MLTALLRLMGSCSSFQAFKGAYSAFELFCELKTAAARAKEMLEAGEIDPHAWRCSETADSYIAVIDGFLGGESLNEHNSLLLMEAVVATCFMDKAKNSKEKNNKSPKEGTKTERIKRTIDRQNPGCIRSEGGPDLRGEVFQLLDVVSELETTVKRLEARMNKAECRIVRVFAPAE